MLGADVFQAPAFDEGILALPDDTGGSAVASGDAALVSEGETPPDVGAVPEPSSWALLITGFAAVGIARRRAVASGRTV